MELMMGGIIYMLTKSKEATAKTTAIPRRSRICDFLYLIAIRVAISVTKTAMEIKWASPTPPFWKGDAVKVIQRTSNMATSQGIRLYIFFISGSFRVHPELVVKYTLYA
jgi:hypothetical protein